jgi:hypothetical protein
MTKQEKLQAIATTLDAFAENPLWCRHIDSILSRCPVGKRSFLSLMKSSDNRAAVELLTEAVESIEFVPGEGYVASGNGAFGHLGGSSRRARYGCASVRFEWVA